MLKKQHKREAVITTNKRKCILGINEKYKARNILKSTWGWGGNSE